MLASLPVEVMTPSEVGIHLDVEEAGDSYEANAVDNGIGGWIEDQIGSSCRSSSSTQVHTHTTLNTSRLTARMAVRAPASG
jgi:hypothetical protein